MRQLLDQAIPNMVARVILVLVGMGFVAFGIALSRETLLGSSPISAVPMVLSFVLPVSLGTITFIVNISFVLLQMALLRRDFSPVQFLQIPFLFVFSAAIDLFVRLVSGWNYNNYIICLVWILLGSFSVALGVYLQSQARLVMTPGDALIVTISKVSGWKFSSCKLGFDILQMLFAVVISLSCNGALYGVREGTVISAAIVGPFIHLISRFIGDFERFIPCEGHLTFLPEAK